MSQYWASEPPCTVRPRFAAVPRHQAGSVHSREESSSSQSSVSSPPTSIYSLSKQASPPASPKLASEPPSTAPAVDSVHILVTQDNEQFTNVELDLRQPPAAMREITLARLHIPDDVHPITHIHRGRFGVGAEGPTLSQDAFKAACAAAKDAHTPPLFVLVVERPSPARIPSLPLRDVFPPENRVALEQEKAQELRSNRPAWHRPRASDPSPTSTQAVKPDQHRLASSTSAVPLQQQQQHSETSAGPGHLAHRREATALGMQDDNHLQQPFPRVHGRSPSLEHDRPNPEFTPQQAARRPSAPSVPSVNLRRNSLEQQPLQNFGPNAPSFRSAIAGPDEWRRNAPSEASMRPAPRLQGFSPAGPYLQPMVQSHPVRRLPPGQASLPPPSQYRAIPPNPHLAYPARSIDDLRRGPRYLETPTPNVMIGNSVVRPPPQRLPFPGQPGYDPRLQQHPPFRPATANPLVRPPQPSPQLNMPSFSALPIQAARPALNNRPHVQTTPIRTDLPPGTRPPIRSYDPRYEQQAPPPIRQAPPPLRQANYAHALRLEPGGVLQQALSGDARQASNSRGTRPPPQNHFMNHTDPSRRRHETEADTLSPPPTNQRVLSPERERPTATRHRHGGSDSSFASSSARSDPGHVLPADDSELYGGLSPEEPLRQLSPLPQSPKVEGESHPPLVRPAPEPSAPELWEDDFHDAEMSPIDGGSAKLMQAMLLSEEESGVGTTKPDDWADMIKRFEGMDGDTLRAARKESSQQQESASAPVAQFNFQDDEDDSDEEAATWAKPMASSVQSLGPSDPFADLPPPLARPSLTLEIDQLVAPGVDSARVSSSLGNSNSPSPGLFSAKDQDDQWAVRPPVERVYDNLEKYFPNHDLDKPIVDTGDISPVTPPVQTTVNPPTTAEPAEPVEPAAPKFKHKKSIRVIAQDRKRLLQKAESAVNKVVTDSVTSLLRRKSTKLWGTKTEEVKVGKSGASKVSTIHENLSSTQPQENFSFKWLKGEMIGKGSYGKVYLAFNVTTGDMLAVKQVEMPQTVSDKDNEAHTSNVSALKFEIQTLKDLDHVNIVQYLGFEETTDYLSIFLEYVPGGSVGRCIRKHYATTGTGFEEPLVKFFTSQIISGLSYLHARGILHRDLKADNVLVDNHGVCKISDFGISKRSDDIYNDNVEMSMQGSIFWMAPEVIHNGKRGYSAKVDIWSLGCVAVEMLGGRRPWNTEQMFAALYKLGAERMAPSLPDDVQVSEDATNFLARCFAGDPVLRPTAQQLASDPFITQMPPQWQFSRSSLAKMKMMHREPKA